MRDGRAREMIIPPRSSHFFLTYGVRVEPFATLSRGCYYGVYTFCRAGLVPSWHGDRHEWWASLATPLGDVYTWHTLNVAFTPFPPLG